jgi:hypothetical protein
LPNNATSAEIKPEISVPMELTLMIGPALPVVSSD